MIVEVGIFHQTPFSDPIRDTLGNFEIWSNFRVVNQILKQLPCAYVTRELPALKQSTP